MAESLWEEIARLLNPVAWKAYDSMMATYPDEPTNPVIVEDSLAMAAAVIALLPKPAATIGACARCSAPVVVPDTDPDNMEQECCPKCTADIVRDRPESVVKAEGLREWAEFARGIFLSQMQSNTSNPPGWYEGLLKSTDMAENHAKNIEKRG